jgi:hypothetical protein
VLPSEPLTLAATVTYDGAEYTGAPPANATLEWRAELLGPALESGVDVSGDKSVPTASARRSLAGTTVRFVFLYVGLIP